MPEQSGRPIVLLCCAAVMTLWAGAGHAADRDFYKGKQIRLVVGSESGGGYDAYARLLARYLSAHIPDHPDIVVENMPGAGSLTAMNYIANVAPKDGTYLGAMQNSIAYEPMMGISGKGNAHFDALKMNWIGSMTKEVAVSVFWNPSPVHTFDDLKRKTVTVGSSGAATSNAIFPHLMNAMFGTKFKVIEGYKGQKPIWLAMENGELQGAGGPFYSSLANSHSDWLRAHKVTIVVQMGLEKDPQLPHVPLLYDLAQSTAQRQEMKLAFSGLSMGRPYVMAQGAPSSAVEIMSAAFMEAMKDPALLAQAKTERLDINPLDGVAVDRLVDDMYATPKPIIDKVTAIFVPKGE